jgi:hypothetical protein
MPTARIYQRVKNSMSSGRGHTNIWQLDFEDAQSRSADPLTGWAGGGDTRNQVRLAFPTQEAAVAYCEKQGWEFVVVPAPQKTLKLQSYADNFR